MDLNSMCVDCFKDTGGEDICMNCGFQQSASQVNSEMIDVLPAHTILNKYVIGRVVNIGRDSIVYKAYDMNLERIVAIKEFFPFRSGLVGRLPNGIDVAVDNVEEFTARKEDFITYAQAIRNSRHDNIVAFYDEFEENNTAYHVMEYVEGVSLEQYFDQVDKLSFEEALDVMMPIMEAVEALHQSNIFLKSLSPKNIFITVSGDIKLGGFSDIVVTDSINYPNRVVETNEYSAPESYMGNISNTSDIYSLGAVWYKILSGVTPERADARMKKTNLKSFSKLGVEVPYFIEAVVFKAMSLKEKDRFASVGDFIASIRGEGWQPKHKTNKVKTLLSVAAIFVVLVICAVFVVYHASSNSVVPTKSAEITLWYVDNGDEDLNERWSSIAKNFSSYVETQNKIGNPEITLNAVGIPAEKYSAKLEKAFKNGTAPDIYCSAYLTEDEHAYSLESLYSEVENSGEVMSEAYNKMKDLFENSNKVAVCYDVPALFVSTRSDSVYIPGSDVSLSELQNYKEDEFREFTYPLVCNPAVVLYASYAYGYKDGKDTSVLESLYDDSRTFEFNDTFNTSEIFDDSVKYYLGFVSEYNLFESKWIDKFEMIPLTGSKVKHSYIYPEVWSVNNASAPENSKASVFLLYYLLNTTEGQRTVSSAKSNTYYLPLKQDVVDEIVTIDETYSKIVKSSYTALAGSAAEYAFKANKADKISSVSKKTDSTKQDFNKVAKLTYK